MKSLEAAQHSFDALGGPSPSIDRSSAAAYVRSIFEREMGVTLNNAKAGSKRDDAMRELTREATNLYARRVLRELIQNAYDGARTASAPKILLRLDLSDGPNGTIYVANNGQGFTSDNVDAISNPAMSNKTPGNFIGHKGLGFRSVELLSDGVEVFSKGDHAAAIFDGFCFRFASPDDERAWIDSSDEPALMNAIVGKVHRLQLPIPIDHSDARADSIARDGFSTLVRLPLRDAVATGRAIEEMRLLADEVSPVTLFLDRLQSLVFETVEADRTSHRKELRRTGKGAHKSTFGRSLMLEEISVDRHRYLVGRMEVDDAAFRKSVDRAVTENHPVDRWKDWVGVPSVSVALPLSPDARAGNFYAFLPMDTPAPFNGCLDAPFHPHADRRGLDLDNPLNSFLLDSVADLCLAIAQTIAASDTSSSANSAAAVDALAWSSEPHRLFEACQRADLEVGELQLPASRGRNYERRWAPLCEIYDWVDAEHRIITGLWLARTCSVPMLRRGLGHRRVEALREFIDQSEYRLDADGPTVGDWVPMLAADLASRRRKATKQNWEDFYLDLTSLRHSLPQLRGKAVFRLEDGSLGAANSPETLGERELFISADPENATRRRKRVTGTTLFPPKSVAQRMLFADPLLSWPSAVTSAFVDAGLATEFSLPRVIGGLGRLLGKRPTRQIALTAISWAFTAWKSHKSNEVEKALLTANLPVPTADGRLRLASKARFGAGWRDTVGDTLRELCNEISVSTRSTKALCDSLLGPWEEWPLRDRGTATEWVQFLRLLGVKDGLTPIFYGAVSQHVSEWMAVRRGQGRPIAVEAHLGDTWKTALAKRQRGFGYQSGIYSTGDTLFALPLQREHAEMNDRAKKAYARLIVKALPDLAPKHFTTILSRTAGMVDNIPWTSPLLAFLTEAEWLPVTFADQLSWKRPRECWFAPRADSLPHFLPRLDRTVRESIDISAASHQVFASRLGLRLWNEKDSALPRLEELGAVLERGIPEHEHDSFRSEYRQAWSDWNAMEPSPRLPQEMALAVQSSGRLVPYQPTADAPQTVFVSGGADPTLDNLLMALGHRLLSVPSETAEAVAGELASRGADEIRLVDDVKPSIIVDSAEFDLTVERPRLVEGEREWLAEIAVLALEFHNSPINRSTPRSRRALFEDFRRLRIIHARDIEVEVDGRRGPLPEMLAGILPVPHIERPTIIMQSSGSGLDWNTLARLSRGIALALGRAWLLTDFRMVFLAISVDQPKVSGQLTRPDDDAIATAFGQPVTRIQEIQRSLRSGSRRIMDWLLPIVGVQLGLGVANQLLDRESTLVEDDEIVSAIVQGGGDGHIARGIVIACRKAEGLDELRRSQGIPLKAFNAASIALGPRFPPLRFDALLRRSFDDRKEELRPSLVQRVRDAHAAASLADVRLDLYRSALTLDWITFDERWPEELDELSDSTIDARVNTLASSALPTPTVEKGDSVDNVRQHNRATLASQLETIRHIGAAWASKKVERSLPASWKGKLEGQIRDAIGTCAFDFVAVEAASLPEVLAVVGMWPTGMPKTIKLPDLGLVAADLDLQRQAEEQRQQNDLRQSRIVKFGETEIEGGSSGSLQAVVNALQNGLASKAFESRSGPAILQPFPDGDERPPRKRTRGESSKEPTYLTDPQRDLIGFAGEYAAYVHLKRTVRNFADEHWLSSLGRRFLCLGLVPDCGYDFHVPRSRSSLYYEVKAHTGDPGYVDLERSQVEAAVQYADGKNGVWKILYISNVLDPNQITVHELANPFSEGNLRLFRPSSRQGVRLLIDRQ